MSKSKLTLLGSDVTVVLKESDGNRKLWIGPPKGQRKSSGGNGWLAGFLIGQGTMVAVFGLLRLFATL